ncbi:MAG: ABC transporter ATP-binding protein [Bryobacteraceae bacterium]
MEEEIIGKVYDRRLMWRLVSYLAPYRRAVLLSLGFLLVHSVLQTAGPLLTKIAVDRYLSPTAAQDFTPLDSYLSANPREGLLQLVVLYFAALVGVFLFEFGQTYVMQYTGQQAMFDLRREIMSHLQRLDVAFYDRNPVGRLVTRVTSDVDALNELLSSGLVTILGDLLTLSFVLYVMVSLSPMLTLIVLGALPFVVLVTVTFRRVVAKSYRRIRLAVARINSYLQEHVVGIVVLQLFNRERKSAAEFEEINRGHMLAFKDTITAYGWFYPAVEFLSLVSLAGILSYSGWALPKGTVTLGVLVAFLQYAMRFFRPIQDLSEKYNILQAAMASAERIFKLLDTPVDIRSPERPVEFPTLNSSIEFDHVWFAYKGEEWVLRDVSFRIEPGETIAIVGHTGAGKTTIISLLLRFYDIQRGAIRIGGVDIRDLDPLDLRRHFGVVLQDPFLFTGTIEENIRLGTVRITQEDVADAAEQVNLLDFVNNLPHGFDQPIQERGASLSTGQKQLISFARALAHEPRYLILDEATSSVDTETEQRVREALGRMIEGRTSIVIAHRLSTIQRADRILVMHKGQLREQGPHQELIAMRGIYYKLYQLQYKDQDVAR